MAAYIKKKDRIQPPVTGAAVTEPPSVTPVRQQVRELSGFSNREELRDALPDSTASQHGDEPKTRKRRTKLEMGQASEDMQDPRYAKAVAKMTALGGARGIKTGFKVAATVLNDKEVMLDSEECELWDDYFYVIGKKSKFDPSNPWYLAGYGVLALVEQVLTRVWKANAGSFANSIAELFGLGPKKEETEEQSEAAIAGAD